MIERLLTHVAWLRRRSVEDIVLCDGGMEGLFIQKTNNAMNQLIEAARGLVDYRRRAGPLNFQLEKADDFIFQMSVALEEVEEPSKAGKANE